MKVSPSQALQLVASVCIAVPDPLDCDSCFEQISGFADTQLCGDRLSLSQQAVEVHLSQCPCCKYEYETLLESMLAAEGSLRNP